MITHDTFNPNIMAMTIYHLKQKKQRLAREIHAKLDFLVGSVTSQGSRPGFSLTFKEDGKTRSKYIRTSMVDEVRKMTARHQELKELLKELSLVNWEILKAENQPRS
jgi:hypothetical protein